MDQKEEPLPPRPGSAAWWNELDDLKAKTRYTPGRTTAQSHHRSQQSRSHSRMSFQDDDEDTSVVQEESDLTRTPVTGSMRRRAYQRHPRAQSVLEGAAITSAPSRLRSTADFNSAGGPARSRTAMGLNGDDSSPASAGTARNGPVESPLRHRRDLYEQADSSTRSHPASPGLPRRSPLKTAGNEHHRLLGEAMEHLERFSGTRSGSGPSFGHTPEHVRKLAIVSDLTTSLNSELRTLVADLVEAQVEAEMSMETNGQTGPETSLDQTIKQTERRLARLLRTSDEQVRGLTESALAISRYSREQDADNTKRSESRATTARPSLDEDRSYMEEEGEGANVSRSRSLGTGITQRRARRYQTESEVPNSNYTSRRPKDSVSVLFILQAQSLTNRTQTGTVKAGPAFHYPRHSVASTSALSNETAQANHSQSQSGRTRAISLDADPYDYSYEDRSDEEETMVMSKGTSRRDTMSESEDYDQHPRRRRPSAAERSTAAAALRLGLGALTAEGIGSRYRSRKKPSQ